MVGYKYGYLHEPDEEFLRIPPANQPDARRRFWDQMVLRFRAAEDRDAGPHDGDQADHGRWYYLGGPSHSAAQIAHTAAAPQRPPEWRWPDISGAKKVLDHNFDTMPGHNDTGDALRHAETARQISEKLGPSLTEFLGNAREYWERVWGQPRGDTIMDIQNNSEGVNAYRQGRPIDLDSLQKSPGPNPRRSSSYLYK